jgi:hypothetical protein
VAGVVAHIPLCGPSGLSPSTAHAVAGAIIAARLLHGRLFDGLPRSPEHPGRERLITVSIVTVVSAALYGLLTPLSRQER